MTFRLLLDLLLQCYLQNYQKPYNHCEKFTNSISNYMICLNKTNISTTLEDIEEVLIYNDIPIRNIKQNIKADSTRMTVNFSLVNSSGRT